MRVDRYALPMLDRDAVLRKASELVDLARASEAIDLLRDYLERASGDAEAHAMIGVAYYNNSEPWAAERHLKHSLAALPGRHEIKVLLLRILMDRHSWEEALEHAEELKRENPSDAVLRIMYESCLENVERPEVGWERDEPLRRVRIEFTEGGPD